MVMMMVVVVETILGCVVEIVLVYGVKLSGV